MNITIRNVPPEIFKEIKSRQMEHMRKCDTCKYGMGQAAIQYIRELRKNQKDAKS